MFPCTCRKGLSALRPCCLRWRLWFRSWLGWRSRYRPSACPHDEDGVVVVVVLVVVVIMLPRVGSSCELAFCADTTRPAQTRIAMTMNTNNILNHPVLLLSFTVFPPNVVSRTFQM